MNPSLSLLLKIVCNIENMDRGFAIDVGAHHGEYAKFLISSDLFCKIVSFEPNPESYRQLLNGVPESERCEHKAINCALGSKSGALDLYCDTDTATASLLKYDANYLANGIVKKNLVSVITLDNYMLSNPSTKILQLLKIDTQGNDQAVIEGGIGTIMKYRPIIQTEFIYIPLYEGQCSPANLSKLLLSLDYEMYSLNNLHVSPEGRLAFCDALFIPKEKYIPITQKYSCIDDQISFETQIKTLQNICEERLTVIEGLKHACDERLALIQRLSKAGI